MKFKKRRKNNKQLLLTQLFLVLLLFIGIGYSLFSTNLGISGIIKLRKYEKHEYLYDVVKNDAENGNTARKYTKGHADAFDNSGEKDIYYYYSSSANNNVKIGDKCWQILRTTDTGGVKLLYNGKYDQTYKCGSSYVSSFNGQVSCAYNENYDSPAYVGYMYNKVYSSNSSTIVNWGKLQTFFPLSNDEYYVFGNSSSDPFEWNGENQMWVSTMQRHGYSADITLKPTIAGNYTLNYIVDSQTTYDRARIYLDGTLLKTVSGVNQKGTITLGELTTNSKVKVEYTKNNSISSGSDNVMFNLARETGETVDGRYVFGNSFSYNNGKYTLENTIKTESLNDLANYHYTCFNTTGECSTVNYLYGKNTYGLAYYVKLTGGKNINDAMNEMLYTENVNTTNSELKTCVENWYSNQIISYDSLLEDVIVCNDRRQINADTNGWNPNGGSFGTEIKFQSSTTNRDLSCPNELDRFSIYNESAKSNYKIGIPSAEELSISQDSISNCSIFINSSSPISFSEIGARIKSTSTNCTMSDINVTSSNKIRPTISLKPGIEFAAGDGTIYNPYVIELN